MMTGNAIRRAKFEYDTFPHLDTLWSTAQWLTMRHSLAEKLLFKTMTRAYLEWQDADKSINRKVQLLRKLTRNFFDSYKDKQPWRYTSPLHSKNIGTNSYSGINKQHYSMTSIKNSLLMLADTPDLVVNVAITRFRPLHRLMIILLYREQCSYDDIAYITDLPKITVKARFSKLRQIIPGYILESADYITEKSNNHSTVDKSGIKLDRNLKKISFKLSPISLKGNTMNSACENWENEGGAVVKMK